MRRPFVAIVALFATLAALAAVQAQTRTSSDSVTPAGSFVDVENGKIYYEECGSARTTVVLIHDGIAHSVVWDAVWASFCKNFVERRIRLAAAFHQHGA